MIKAPAGQAGQKRALLHKAVGPQPSGEFTMRGVVLMGNDFRGFILRLVVSLGIIVMILLLTAPKAC